MTGQLQLVVFVVHEKFWFADSWLVVTMVPRPEKEMLGGSPIGYLVLNTADFLSQSLIVQVHLSMQQMLMTKFYQMYPVNPLPRPSWVESLDSEEWTLVEEEKLEKWKCVRSRDVKACFGARSTANSLVVQMHSSQ